MLSFSEIYRAATRRALAQVPTDADVLICDNAKTDASNNANFKVSLTTLATKLAALIAISPTAGIGYQTGAGAAVTQGTSKSTGVTINAVTGAITLDGAALTNGSTATFTVTNSAFGANDTVSLIHKSGGTLGGYALKAHTPAAGSFKIAIKNESGGDLSEAPVIQFNVFKGAVA